MKYLLKKISAIVLTLIFVIIAAVSTSAATGYNTNNGTDSTNPLSDTTEFTFTKHYDLAGDTTNGSSPAEDFTITFTPYSVANTPAGDNITTENMPTLDSITLSAAKGAADTDNTTNITTTVTLPSYTFIGDYWYKVQETAGKTAGVTYDSNEYYLHVQVVHASETSDDLIRLVTLHTNAPKSDGTPDTSDDTKNDGITNTYSNGSLFITKKVKGNMGDLTKEYKATVVFSYSSTDSTTCPVKSDIKYTDGTEKTLSGWSYSNNAWTATVELTLSNKETVTFTNIPYGVTYTVTETDYSTEGYSHSFAFSNGESDDTVTAETTGNWSAAGASGSISDASDTLTITNEKTTVIDVGVLTENLPFIILIVLIGAAAVTFIVLAVRKRRNISE